MTGTCPPSSYVECRVKCIHRWSRARSASPSCSVRRRSAAWWSSCSPVVALLAQPQIDERFRGPYPRQRPEPARDEGGQLVVVLADDLDEQVERPRGDDDVVDLA